MINNIASAVFGFIYISLWQSVAPVSAADTPYTRSTMVAFIILAQVFAWVSIFLPAGLNIPLMVRTGSVAVEVARPIPFFPMILAREGGSLLYQAVFRAVPVALMFAVTIGFPAPASIAAALWTVPSLLLGSYIALMLVFLVGITSIWTVEVRWAQNLYYTVTTLLSGGWIPSDLLPGWLGKVAPYLPFASQMFHPIRIYLGLVGPEVIFIQMFWAVALTATCQAVTTRALQRVWVQGG